MKSDTVHDWAKEALSNGKCVIGRFWGQTCIYVPSPFCDRLDEGTVYRLAVEVFTKESIDGFVMGGIFRGSYKGKNYCTFEVPTSLNPAYNQNQKDNPDYCKPDTLVEKIMALG